MEVFGKRRGIKIEEEVEVLKSYGRREFGWKVLGVGLANELLEELLAELGTVAGFASDEPILVTALTPALEVMIIEMFTLFSEPGNDGLISKAVQKQEVNGLAQSFREAGDFSIAGFAGPPRGVWKDTAVCHRNLLLGRRMHVL